MIHALSHTSQGLKQQIYSGSVYLLGSSCLKSHQATEVGHHYTARASEHSIASVTMTSKQQAGIITTDSCIRKLSNISYQKECVGGDEPRQEV